MSDQSPIDDDRLRTEEERRVTLYYETIDRMNECRITNERDRDKYLIMLSSASLVLSMNFYSGVTDNAADIAAKWALIVCWILMITSLALILATFYFSNRAATSRMTYARKYYVERQDQFADKRPASETAAEWLSHLAMLVFLSGIIFMFTFFVRNI